MQELVLHREEENKKTGFILSLAVHVLLLLLLLIPCLSYFDPPLTKQGIMVVFGDLDAGQPNASPNNKAPKASAPVSKPKEEPVKKASPAKAKPVKQEEDTPKKVESKIAQEDSELKAVKQKQVKTTKTKVVDATPSKSAKQQEAEKNQKTYDQAKSKFGSLFSNSSEATQGTKNGKKGDPLGKPDAKSLEGISKGSGRVGGGLSNRGLLYEPAFKDNSQKSGIVVVKICVDNKGNVISTKFTQKGSTTTDNYLVNLAEKEAKKYKFSSSSIEEQCGTITVDFKLK